MKDRYTLSAVHALDANEELWHHVLPSHFRTQEELRFPKKAVATDGTLQIIVNDGFYMQGVRIEVCLKEGSTCQFNEAFPQGYTTICKQKFIARKLVAVNSGKNPSRPIAVQDFLIPSCCVCNVISSSLSFRSQALPKRPYRPSKKRTHSG